MVDALKTVMRGESLSVDTASAVMLRILSGSVPPEQIGALLIALQLKSESVEEIVGFARAVRSQARSFSLENNEVVDTCGTGGDGASTFNISTTVAFVVAGAGQPIAKHGNRAVSSRAGSFDVLEALGVNAAANAEAARVQLHEVGLSFLFAPTYHPILKDLAVLRRSLGVRTVFNLLGPLLNPSGVKRQLIGVFAPELVEKVALALSQLGAERAMVVRGEDGLDEISISTATRISELREGRVTSYMITPEDCGLRSQDSTALAGGDARENARILEKILEGEQGPRRDIVLLNAAAALVVGGRAQDLREGVERAAASIDSGAAVRILSRLREPTLESTGT